jgi:hypothetical protein
MALVSPGPLNICNYSLSVPAIPCVLQVAKLLELCTFWAQQRRLSRSDEHEHATRDADGTKDCHCLKEVKLLNGAFVLIKMAAGAAPRLRRVARVEYGFLGG